MANDHFSPWQAGINVGGIAMILKNSQSMLWKNLQCVAVNSAKSVREA